jgi:hypothetical protein
MNSEISTVTRAEDAEAVLRQRLGGQAANLQVFFQEKGVILRGYVFSYYAKQLASHAAMRAFGLPILANEIEVRWARPVRGPDGPDLP